MTVTKPVSENTTKKVELETPDYSDYEDAQEMCWKKILKDTGKNDPRKNWDTNYVRMNQACIGKNHQISQ